MGMESGVAECLCRRGLSQGGGSCAAPDPGEDRSPALPAQSTCGLPDLCAGRSGRRERGWCLLGMRKQTHPQVAELSAQQASVVQMEVLLL